MAMRILLQGVTQDGHLDTVRHLLRIPQPERIVLCVAFMSEGGLEQLEEVLTPIADRTTIVAGIRNGITTAQGLRKSLSIGCTTFVVDTGSRGVLFHPKVYMARNDLDVRLIVGSANLTVGGLVTNVESSLYVESKLTDGEYASLISDLEAKIDGMIAEYPDHVLRITDDSAIQSLLDSGRVVDETMRPAPTASGSSISRDLDTIPKMALKTRPIARQRFEPISKESAITAPHELPSTASLATPVRERLTQVWRSNPLTRRHLTIPTGATTNPTGSMLFGKGALTDIDQRHYFRDEVFFALPWQFDTAARTVHIERAMARFQLVIRDVNYGIFELRLSHNSRTDSRAYEQRNSMTQLHWGEARRLVAREDLLGRTMYLYRDSLDNQLFVLEID